MTYSASVFGTLLIQYAMRMRCVILSSMAYVALQHFSTLCQKRHDFREKKRLLIIKLVF
jgi:hypothetical protein